MIADRIRNWFGASASVAQDARVEVAPVVVLETADHPSRGLQQALEPLAGVSSLAVLDLGEINQENVGYLTGLGHRHYSEDLLAQLDEAFGRRDFAEAGVAPEKARAFLASVLRFPEQQFDAIFAWDTLQFLPAPLLNEVIARLLLLLRPGGVMLAVFHGGPRHAPVAANSFRVIDHKTLRVVPKYWRQPPQAFNNRSLEELFNGWRSIKFFLTRDSLKEVIARR